MLQLSVHTAAKLRKPDSALELSAAAKIYPMHGKVAVVVCVQHW